MSRDTIGDFLTIIRNGLMARKRSIVDQSSKEKTGIARVLKEEGFIKDFEMVELDGKPFIKIIFKYVNGESVIHEIKRISRPGRRHYESLCSLTSVIGGLGVSILTTNAGIIADKQARKKSVGGEVICHVW
jgi:small subunit ribosomal protein S8